MSEYRMNLLVGKRLVRIEINRHVMFLARAVCARFFGTTVFPTIFFVVGLARQAELAEITSGPPVGAFEKGEKKNLRTIIYYLGCIFFGF